jgi:hypothetical protein
MKKQQRKCQRNQNARVTPRIVPPDQQFSSFAKREMNAESRDHKKSDDCRSAKHERVPPMLQRAAQRGVRIDSCKQREDPKMTHDDPEREYEAQRI